MSNTVKTHNKCQFPISWSLWRHDRRIVILLERPIYFEWN